MSLAEAFATQDMSCGAEMPRYRCHKEVHALKIESVELATPTIQRLTEILENSEVAPGGYLQFDGGGVIAMSTEWIRKHQPKAGGYLVVYEDGYRSFSPAKAFEEGYTRL